MVARVVMLRISYFPGIISNKHFMMQSLSEFLYVVFKVLQSRVGLAESRPQTPRFAPMGDIMGPLRNGAKFWPHL